tara:strand:+ start:655 stop:900 length:246 start_codon:yes stop_codon:yes gene_type:complete
MSSFKDRALRFGAGVGAVGLAVGGLAMGYAHHNTQQNLHVATSGMAEAERQGRIDDIDSLMDSYNKQHRPNKRMKPETGAG